MSQGNLSSWQVKEGDEVSAGSILAEIETDKATLEWENQDDGFVAKILVEAGSKDIPVGTPIAVLVEDESNIVDFKSYSPEGKAAEPPPDRASGRQPMSGEAKGPENGPAKNGLQRLGPAARRLLQEHGLSPQDVAATGPMGIVTKSDVLAAVEGGAKPPSAKTHSQADTKHAPQKQSKQVETAPSKSPGNSAVPRSTTDPDEHFCDVSNSQIRKIIAQRLLESKQTVPHYYVEAIANLEAVSKIRQTMKAQGTKVSVNDFVIRAVALALADVPEANATWDAEAEKSKRAGSVDIAIAVATDKGLITPIIKSADTKSLKQISENVRELAGKARANKLKPEEFQGGSFTISNLGMFGVDHFSAIINPPQAGILAVGGTQYNVSLVDGKPTSRAEIRITLSGDQRIFDGATASKFLQAFCSNMANPVKLLM